MTWGDRARVLAVATPVAALFFSPLAIVFGLASAYAAWRAWRG